SPSADDNGVGQSENTYRQIVPNSTKLDQTRPNSTSVAPPFQSAICPSSVAAQDQTNQGSGLLRRVDNPHSAIDDTPTRCGRRRITHKFGYQNCTAFRGFGSWFP